ncbi:hypothetical protein [Anaerotignum faecicola]|jgi:hypothetical protein
MLTNFSKWMIYTASYIVLYPILIIKILFSAREEDVTFIEKMRLNFSESREIIFVLLGFIVISALVIFILRKVSPNSRCKALLKNNVTYEVASFLLPYIISIFTIDLNWYGWLINVVIYILFGIVMMYADIVHLCPIFIFLGFKLYKDSNDNYIYSKLSKEQYNLLCIEQNDGIESKTLTGHLSLSTVKKF